MGRIEIVAPKALSMEIKPITIAELRADLENISNCLFEFSAIRHEIRGALPTFPEMSRSELYPNNRNPSGPHEIQPVSGHSFTSRLYHFGRDLDFLVIFRIRCRVRNVRHSHDHTMERNRACA